MKSIRYAGKFRRKNDETKKEILKYVLSNCWLDGKNVIPVYKKTFDMVVEYKKERTGCPTWIRTTTPRSRDWCATITL